MQQLEKRFTHMFHIIILIKNIPCPDSTWDIMQQDIKDGTEVTVISKIGYLSHVIESEHVTQEQIETSKETDESVS